MKLSKNRIKKLPAVSTASLPDIIFMLLFFFMVVTVLRDSTLKVKIRLPQASDLTKLELVSLVNHIHIGQAIGDPDFSPPQIQLNDKFASIDDIPYFLKDFKKEIPKNMHNKIKTDLRVDHLVTMGIVTDVKTALRKSEQYAINYSARRSE